MAEIKAVKEPTPDPKTGKPKPKSGVSVPYYDIDHSIIVAKTIHDQGGGACSREQLAPLLKYSGTNNGGFLTRISAAKMFGLVEESSDSLRVTTRGQQIISPVIPTDVDRAKVEAFLSVDFFANFYERFKGNVLPQEAGLKNLLENTYSIVPGRVVPSLRVLLDSAEQAGFFRVAGNRSKMVMPIIPNQNADGQPPPGNSAQQNEQGGSGNGERTQDEGAQKGGRGKHAGGGGGGGGDSEIPAALIGLLEKLPPLGTALPPKRRKALTDAFSHTIDFLYPDPEDED